jgi:hypothetical protein
MGFKKKFCVQLENSAFAALKAMGIYSNNCHQDYTGQIEHPLVK